MVQNGSAAPLMDTSWCFCGWGRFSLVSQGYILVEEGNISLILAVRVIHSRRVFARDFVCVHINNEI